MAQKRKQNLSVIDEKCSTVVMLRLYLQCGFVCKLPEMEIGTLITGFVAQTKLADLAE